MFLVKADAKSLSSLFKCCSFQLPLRIYKIRRLANVLRFASQSGALKLTSYFASLSAADTWIFHLLPFGA